MAVASIKSQPVVVPSHNGGSAFLGLSGMWREWANLGIAGVLCGILIYLLVFTVPATQEKFHQLLREEREMFRNEILYQRELNQQQLELSRENQKTLDQLLREIKALKREQQ